MHGRSISFRQSRNYLLTEQDKIDTEADQHLDTEPLAFSDQPEEEMFGSNIGMA